MVMSRNLCGRCWIYRPTEHVCD